VKAESFFARDNVAQFINWCRSELGISDTIMFETEDLVLRKNEKNFILTLLEVIRTFIFECIVRVRRDENWRMANLKLARPYSNPPRLLICG